MDNEEQKRLRIARRIIREFSEQFGKKITFNQDLVNFEDIGVEKRLLELIEATEQFQVELIEDGLPLVLFHMYDDLVIEQAKNYLAGKPKVAEFEFNILTYRPLPRSLIKLEEENQLEKQFSDRLPFIIEKEGLYWTLGVQCGNKKGDSLMINGHNFIPIKETSTEASIKKMYDLFLKSNQHWETTVYVGELGENTGLYYAFGDRIADFLITRELFSKISKKTSINEINSYTVISRHFIIFSKNEDLRKLDEISNILFEAAEKDQYLQQVFGVKDENDLLGKYHVPQKTIALPQFELGLKLSIKIDFSGGELLAVL